MSCQSHDKDTVMVRHLITFLVWFVQSHYLVSLRQQALLL